MPSSQMCYAEAGGPPRRGEGGVLTPEGWKPRWDAQRDALHLRLFMICLSVQVEI